MRSQDTPWGAEELLLNTEIAGNDGIGDLAVRKIDLDADEMTPLHRHQSKNEVLVVRDGLIELAVGDDYIELGADDAHFIEAGTPHQLQNISSGVATVLEIGIPFDPDDATVLDDPYT